MKTINQTATKHTGYGRKLRMSGIAMCSALLLAGMTSCEDDNDDPIVDTYNQQDRNFAVSSSQNINAQIKLGELAKTSGQDDSVLDYASMLVTQNTESKNELVGILDGTDVDMSKEITAAMQAEYDELAALTGAEFDMQFIESQIDILDSSKSIFENQNDNGENYTLKGFSAKTLGKVKDHKAKAVLVKAELKIEGI